MSEEEIATLVTKFSEDLQYIRGLLCAILVLMLLYYVFAKILPEVVYSSALHFTYRKDIKQWTKERKEKVRKEFNEKWREDNAE